MLKKIPWDKVKTVVLIVAAVAVVAFLVKSHLDGKKRQEDLTKQVVEMKRLQDEAVRSRARYVTKEDFEQFAKDMDIDLDLFKKDIGKVLDARMIGLHKLIAESRGYYGTNLGSTGTQPRDPSDPVDPEFTCPDGTTCPDPYGYLKNAQTRSLFEPFSDETRIAIGDVTFRAWEPKPWTVSIFPRRYHVNTVLSQDEDGRHYVHNQFQIEVNGEKHNIPVKQSDFVERLPEADFHFNPRLNLGVGIGALIATQGVLPPDEARARAEVAPSLGVSFFSYGETKVNPTWKFLEVGVNYETQEGTLGFHVNPVDYNIGKPIPLIDNMYLGPTVGVDIEGKVMVGAGIRVGL